MRWFILGVGLLLWSCGPISERKQPPPNLQQLAQSDLDLSGEQLANGYCAACHLKPEPEILDKLTWQTKVLPDMRKRMGLYLEEDFGTALPEDEGVPPGIYSKAQLISRENWQKLETYYLENAPEKPLPQAKSETPKVGIPGFELEIPEFPFVRSSLTTMLRVHPKSGNLWVGHRFRALYVLDSKKKFSQIDSISTPVAPVEIRWKSDESFDLLSMGLMDPANDSLGVLSTYSTSDKTNWNFSVQEKLIRPAHVEFAEWNGDGTEDYLISHFGNHVGKLSLYLSKSGAFEEVILKKDPGARRTIAIDFDQDGDQDILALMTQAKESVILFENEGGGKFQERVLLAFHPAFGSSDFRYQDMTGDGLPDLILVNGDNADQSQILKYYHGVRIFKNTGEGEFEESWFYPMHGASGLEVGDFDLDGDMDLVSISFFPDKNQQPKQDLIYFRQSSSGKFEPHILANSPGFHWLTISQGDVDLDGDQDLLIGTFAFDQLYKPPTDTWKPFVILRNRVK
ncbi:VCBS repeat-containing protein [Algoriphagus lacus]|uniref:VCBS repeat-containing protein n=1 Tax=Algoriphagus lacus TaxID=2056311 RepID=A0A418PUP5_9BACT|nr:VCBS repeat-containing protein [Algoriphagus lacus]RIW17304.1 VCBS repeat-containing protein [Algoriphagus lacus]